MIPINANTKIAYILKQNPDALEAIISISPKFNKLRNPLLRKLMAPRTSLSMASKIGGCELTDFFEKLKPLGFETDRTIAEEENSMPAVLPEFMKNLTAENTVVLDVRPVLDEGKDPLSLILKTTNEMKLRQVLKLINSFEPVPLIQLLEKRGFESYTEIVSENETLTCFFKSDKVKTLKPGTENAHENWNETLARFEGKLKTIDVRHLEMPLPMLTILDGLDNLQNGMALYVYHKRIPVFLLPELQERKFEYRIREVSDGEVYLLIFKA